MLCSAVVGVVNVAWCILTLLFYRTLSYTRLKPEPTLSIVRLILFCEPKCVCYVYANSIYVVLTCLLIRGVTCLLFIVVGQRWLTILRWPTPAAVSNSRRSVFIRYCFTITTILLLLKAWTWFRTTSKDFRFVMIDFWLMHIYRDDLERLCNYLLYLLHCTITAFSGCISQKGQSNILSCAVLMCTDASGLVVSDS